MSSDAESERPISHSAAVNHVRRLVEENDWGCIWCETMFDDGEVVHDHDYSFDEPLCPECPDSPDLADIDTYLTQEVLP